MLSKIIATLALLNTVLNVLLLRNVPCAVTKCCLKVESVGSVLLGKSTFNRHAIFARFQAAMNVKPRLLVKIVCQAL